MQSDKSSDERELDLWLTQTLQRNGDYIEDSGFTDRVMQRLPSPASRRWLSILGVLLSACFAGVLALTLIPAQAWVEAVLVMSTTHFEAWMTFSPVTMMLMGGLATSVLVVGLSVWVWQEE